MESRMSRVWAIAFMIAALLHTAQAQGAAPKKALFILGDSLVDPGNNNYINTLAKSNFLPNGIDFPGGARATGRFCNGRSVADVLSEKLGMPFAPAYLDPNARGSAILGGVNYASAAGGIIDSTGANYIGRIGLNQQIQYFQRTQQDFISQLGPAAASQAISNAIYIFVIGSNDYINNYLQPGSPRARQFTPQQYEAYLATEFGKQLTTMYNLGARKMLIFNVGPLGCIPSQLATQRSRDGSCIQFINDYVKGFNRAAGLELNRLTPILPGSTLVYGNAYDLVINRVNNPQQYGLTVVNQGCCGLGQYNGQLPCLQNFRPCGAKPQRDSYLFWDPFHPTDFVNAQLAEAFYTGGLNEISPINFKQLAAM